MAAMQRSTRVHRSCLGGTLRGNLKFYFTRTENESIVGEQLLILIPIDVSYNTFNKANSSAITQ